MSVEQITSRAGVSRATFFNYFSAKSDLLWADLDPALAATVPLAAELPGGLDAADAVSALLTGVAGVVRSAPAVLVERSVIDASDAVAEAGLPRLLALERTLRRTAQVRTSADAAEVEGFTSAVVGALAAGGRQWIDAGIERGQAASFLGCLEPVLSGYRPVLPPLRARR